MIDAAGNVSKRGLGALAFQDSSVGTTYSAGVGLSLSATNIFTNIGVTSIIGTANQILVNGLVGSGVTGAITLTLPQGIGTTSNVQFNNLTIGGTFVSVGSTNLVTNLNANYLNGIPSSGFLTVGGTGSLPYVNDATNTTLTRSGSGPYTLGLNLGNTNVWTALQTFSGGATISTLTTTGNVGIGGTLNLSVSTVVGSGTTALMIDAAGNVSKRGLGALAFQDSSVGTTYSAGVGLSLSATNIFTNIGVTSIIGTANQILVNGLVGSGVTGAITLTLPQGIGTTSNVQFNNLTIGGTFVSVGSTNLVTNLNANYLNGIPSSGFLTVGGTGSLPYVNDATNTTLTRSGSGPYTLGLNLGNTNVWTALQTFSGGATISTLTTTGNVGIGGTLNLSVSTVVGSGTTALMIDAAGNVSKRGLGALAFQDSSVGTTYSAGVGLSLSATNIFTNIGVTSIIGTANQILVNGLVGSGVTGAITLTLPQGIGTTSNVQFNNLTIGGTFVSVGSTNLVTNLNANYLNGIPSSGFLTVGGTGSLPYVNDATNTTLTRSGSGPYTLGLNLGNTNVWTALQTFSGGATISTLTTTGNVGIGGTLNLSVSTVVGSGTTALMIDAAGNVSKRGLGALAFQDSSVGTTYSAGVGLSLSATNIFTNIGVTSIIGTANQILVNGLVGSGVTGAITLTLPQGIGTTSNVQFNNLTIGGTFVSVGSTNLVTNLNANYLNGIPSSGFLTVGGTGSLPYVNDATNTTLTRSGSGPYTLGLNLGNTNVWTALQTFSGGATISTLTTTGNVGIGGTLNLSVSTVVGSGTTALMIDAAGNVSKRGLGALAFQDSSVGTTYSAGVGLSLSATNIFTNIGVTSIIGTANQILVNGLVGSGVTGAITLTLPQGIGTTSNVQFNNLTIGGTFVSVGSTNLVTNLNANYLNGIPSSGFLTVGGTGSLPYVNDATNTTLTRSGSGPYTLGLNLGNTNVWTALQTFSGGATISTLTTTGNVGIGGTLNLSASTVVGSGTTALMIDAAGNVSKRGLGALAFQDSSVGTTYSAGVGLSLSATNIFTNIGVTSIIGTANQILVNGLVGSGVTGAITLTLPQGIGTTSNVQFNNLTIGGTFVSVGSTNLVTNLNANYLNGIPSSGFLTVGGTGSLPYVNDATNTTLTRSGSGPYTLGLNLGNTNVWTALQTFSGGATISTLTTTGNVGIGGTLNLSVSTVVGSGTTALMIDAAGNVSKRGLGALAFQDSSVGTTYSAGVGLSLSATNIFTNIGVTSIIGTANQILVNGLVGSGVTGAITLTLPQGIGTTSNVQFNNLTIGGTFVSVGSTNLVTNLNANYLNGIPSSGFLTVGGTGSLPYVNDATNTTLTRSGSGPYTLGLNLGNTNVWTALQTFSGGATISTLTTTGNVGIGGTLNLSASTVVGSGTTALMIDAAGNVSKRGLGALAFQDSSVGTTYSAGVGLSLSATNIFTNIGVTSIIGTANQILVNGLVGSGVTGAITLTLPQGIGTTSNVQFNNLTIGGTFVSVGSTNLVTNLNANYLNGIPSSGFLTVGGTGSLPYVNDATNTTLTRSGSGPYTLGLNLGNTNVWTALQTFSGGATISTLTTTGNVGIGGTLNLSVSTVVGSGTTALMIDAAGNVSKRGLGALAFQDSSVGTTYSAGVGLSLSATNIFTNIGVTSIIGTANQILVNGLVGSGVTGAITLTLPQGIGTTSNVQFNNLTIGGTFVSVGSTNLVTNLNANYLNGIPSSGFLTVGGTGSLPYVNDATNTTLTRSGSGPYTLGLNLGNTNVWTALQTFSGGATISTLTTTGNVGIGGTLNLSASTVVGSGTTALMIDAAGNVSKRGLGALAFQDSSVGTTYSAGVGLSLSATNIFTNIGVTSIIGTANQILVNGLVGSGVTGAITLTLPQGIGTTSNVQFNNLTIGGTFVSVGSTNLVTNLNANYLNGIPSSGFLTVGGTGSLPYVNDATNTTLTRSGSGPYTLGLNLGNTNVWTALQTFSGGATISTLTTTGNVGIGGTLNLSASTVVGSGTTALMIDAAGNVSKRGLGALAFQDSSVGTTYSAGVGLSLSATNIFTNIGVTSIIGTANQILVNGLVGSGVTGAITLTLPQGIGTTSNVQFNNLTIGGTFVSVGSTNLVTNLNANYLNGIPSSGFLTVGGTGSLPYVNDATNTTLTRSGSGPYTLGLNLGNTNVWTALQTFSGGATISTLTTTGNVGIGGTLNLSASTVVGSGTTALMIDAAGNVSKRGLGALAFQDSSVGTTYSAGVGLSLSATNIFTNIGVTSIIGTANQILVNGLVGSGVTGAITLTLPQGIGTTSNVQFNNLTIGGTFVSVGSTNLVTNLNANYLNGIPSSGFLTVGGTGSLPYVNDATNTTLTRSGSGPYTLGLNLGNTNVWTALQTFSGGATISTLTTTGNVGIGGTLNLSASTVVGSGTTALMIDAAGNVSKRGLGALAFQDSSVGTTYSAGVGLSLSATNIFTNIGVTSIIGTANQILVNGLVGSGVTGAITLTLPQGIGTTSNVQFNNLTIGGTFVSVGSTNLVTNLNANYLNGIPSSGFLTVGGTGSLPYVNDATNTTLTRSGSGPYTLGLNLGNTNVWTALQTFSGGATISTLTTTGNVGIGGTLNLSASTVVGSGTTALMIDAAGNVSKRGLGALAFQDSSVGTTYSAGVGLSLSATNIFTNIGVTSIIGTANQILVNGLVGSGVTGAITLTLPQGIGTTSNVQFNNLTIGGTFVSVGSTNLVTNLNANYLNGIPSSGFLTVGGTGSLPYVNDATNTTLTRSGSGPYTLGLNLGNTNVWTALQTFSGGATISALTTTGRCRYWWHVKLKCFYCCWFWYHCLND